MTPESGPPVVVPDGFIIRSANSADLQYLPPIELASGLAFITIGMGAIAEDDPPTPEDLAEYERDGRCWVVDRVPAAQTGPVAYLIAEAVDGCCHIEQVSVHPDAAGHGIGRALIEWAERWGSAQGFGATTLTTFVDVPWNGPYYERLGFRYLDLDEETPGLQAIRGAEREQGIDRWPRACMRREISPGA